MEHKILLILESEADCTWQKLAKNLFEKRRIIECYSATNIQCLWFELFIIIAL